ncbi:MAG: carbon-nitrogen hydrolase family protein [Betaproteobacteria bacterium]|nr:carbon-nitrogen hydrolase family protein [Betaproteobacteria bacterium]
MAPRITVASTSLQSVVADIDANMKKAKEVIAKAAGRGAEVIVFPELFLPGYACGESDQCFELSEPIPGPSTEALVTEAVRHKIYIAMGLIEADQEFHGVIHNTAVLVGPEGIVHVHRKVQLPEHMNLKELHYGFSPGDNFSVCKIKQNWKVGLAVCRDIFFPEGPRVMAVNGMDLLLTLTAGPTFAKERWEAFVPVRAIENSVFHVMANVVGTQWDNMTFFGGAMIVSPTGVFLARGKVDEEDLIVATLDEKELFETRKGHPFLRDRRPSAYQDLVSTRFPHL